MLAADPPTAIERHDNSEKEVLELPLLLPRQQWEALEIAAGTQGMTTGQLVRRLITDFLDEPFLD